MDYSSYSRSKLFHFHAVFGKKLKNNSTFGSWRTPLGKILDPPLLTPLLGNSGSATGLFNVLNQSVSSFADLRIGCPRCTPLSPKFIQFHAVFWEVPGKLRGIWSRPTPKGKLRGNWLPPPPTATAAGSTHPTGMHSCWRMRWLV